MAELERTCERERPPVRDSPYERTLNELGEGRPGAAAAQPERGRAPAFNLDPEMPALWAAFIHIPIQEHLASDLQQSENSPEFKE
jgi:hypothetical protein